MAFIPPLSLFAASAGQDPRSLLVYYGFLAGAVLAGGIVFLFVIRKFLRSGRGSADQIAGLDLGAVENMRRKGLLSPEEAKRLRQAVVRQTTGEGNIFGKSRDESAGSGLALRPTGPPVGEGAPPAPAPSATAGRADSPEPAPAPAPATGPHPDSAGPPKPKPGAKPLDLDALLERGLITQAERDKLKKTFG